MKFKLLALTIASSVTLLLSGCGSDDAAPAFQMPPQSVDYVVMDTQTITFSQHLPARAVASAIADVRPQVTGIIKARLFEEGSVVKAGQALYQIDDTIYQANLTSAKAELVRSQANLRSLKAEVSRYTQLLKDKAASQQQYDQANANYLAMVAEIDVRKAAIHKAQVDIAYTKVKAPISGQISKSNITVGALVTAAQSQMLTTITQLDPIYFDMVQSNTELRNINRRLASGELNNVEQTAQLSFSKNDNYSQLGQLNFNEVRTNVSTDTVTLRAQFNNPKHELLPGMFAQIDLTQATRDNSILVPQSAVSFDKQGQANVFVLLKDNTVGIKQLTVGRSVGQDWLALTGLESGDKVITTGLQKIGPGMTVVPVAPQANKAQEG
ncbi:efflux RND transporter periplasmic adaptor subunit [Psychrobium sp. nBUS_13]|uniref:efflux RND transporter periplasmic adaptor subunit n=1 Tax=Psychrobium sp. nBUS_13 TaxID=3395319 RepID=UPI003EBA295D